MQAVLWLNAILLFPYNGLTVNGVLASGLIYGWCASVSALLWVFIKSLLVESAKIKPLELQLGRIRRDRELFRGLVSSPNEVDFDAVDDDITVGNLDAPIHIVAVTDPYCSPCKSTHEFLAQLQTQHSDAVRLSFVFHVKSGNVEDKSNSLIIRILNLPVSARSHALEHWFRTSDLGAEATRSTDGNDSNGLQLFKNHKNWCAFNGIAYTPTLYVNGHKIPVHYDLHSLSYQIRAMQDELVA